MPHPTFELRRAYLSMRKAMDETLRPFGLTAAHFEVLQLLILDDCSEHRVLQERLGVSSPTLSNILDSMESRGLIARQVSDADARVKEICMSDRARALHDSREFGAAGNAFADQMFIGFTRQERAAFLDSLDKIARNLESKAN
jgi:DNA-binding MarR family transcriptional regulator